MLIDALGPAGPLHSAHGLVDDLRAVLADASCPQWTGTAGEGYRARRDEAVAQAHTVLEEISQALALVPSFEAECAKTLAAAQRAMSTSCKVGIGMALSGRW